MRSTYFLILATYWVASAAAAQGYVPGEVIVKLKGKAGTQEAYAFLGKAGSAKEMRLRESFGKANTYHFSVKAGQSVEAAIAELNQDPSVEYAEPNFYLTKSDDTGIFRTYTSEEIQQLSLETQSSQGSSSSQSVVWATGGVDIGLDQFHLYKSVSNLSVAKPVVAVIDTGLDLNHPVFVDSNSIWTNPAEIPNNGIDDDNNGYIDDVNGWNFVDNSKTMYDDDHHGTHVSGIVLSVDQNILAHPLQESRIAIMPLKFLDGNGSGTTSNAVRAIYYAVDNGATVLNNSWGGPSYSGALHEAIAYAYSHGVVFIAAAGNAGGNNDSTPMYPASYDVPNVISTAATTSSDYLASFSNYGHSTVHLGSPGVMIYSTIPGGGFGSASGTSMASPFVAGVAIQMKVESPNMLAYQLKSVIFSQADHVTPLIGKVYTEGRVDALSSINYATSASVDSSQPAYYGAFSQNRELASSLAGGGCGMVKSGMGGPGEGTDLRGPQTWYVLLIVGLLALPVVIMNYLRSRAPENRRKHERFRINSEVSVQVGDRELVASISTISLGGVQLNTEAMLEHGGTVKMMISSPDGKEQVEVEGRVVWTEAQKAYGVAFNNAPRGVLFRIGEWTRALQRSG